MLQGKFILGNKTARTIMFFYSIMLHMLIFLVSRYKLTYFVILVLLSGNPTVVLIIFLVLLTRAKSSYWRCCTRWHIQLSAGETCRQTGMISKYCETCLIKAYATWILNLRSHCCTFALKIYLQHATIIVYCKN